MHPSLTLTLTSLISAVLVLASCSSQPTLPSVDGASRRPVNAAGAVELQVCRSELSHARILLNETNALAETSSAAATRLQIEHQALVADAANALYLIQFATGSTRVSVPQADANALLARARSSARIVLRTQDTPRSVKTDNESPARKRLQSARQYLVQAGVDPKVIRTETMEADGAPSKQPGSGSGIEIEMYRTAPLPFATRMAVAVPGSTNR